MDRFAVISDIHGNMPALEAVFADIKERGLERVVCLGDLAGKGPNPAEAVDLVRARCEAVVKGNWDCMLCRMEHEKLAYHRKRLGPERLAYLSALPLYLEFYMSGKLVRLFHASPFDPFYRTYISSERAERLRLFEPTPTLAGYSDVVGYGDIHGAYAESFEGRTVFNAGSVGNPLDVAQASYAVIEGSCGSLDPSPFSICLVRVPYDVERAVEMARASELPRQDKEDYIRELRTAVYRNLASRRSNPGLAD